MVTCDLSPHSPTKVRRNVWVRGDFPAHFAKLGRLSDVCERENPREMEYRKIQCSTFCSYLSDHVRAYSGFSSKEDNFLSNGMTEIYLSEGDWLKKRKENLAIFVSRAVGYLNGGVSFSFFV